MRSLRRLTELQRIMVSTMAVFGWAIQGDKLLGTFGLERTSSEAMELRRMYVDSWCSTARDRSTDASFCEDECRRRMIFRLELSTSELQEAAPSFYRNSGYRLIREDLAHIGSNKTVGAGLPQIYFEKCL